jgi:serine/threonine protein kinase
MNLITANMFLRELGKHALHLDVCNLNKDSDSLIKFEEHAILLEKDGISAAELVFGNIIAQGINGSLPIAAKIFLNNGIEMNKSDMYNIEGLRYEIKVYQKITQDILSQNYSPNFIGYVGYGECNINKFLEVLSPKNRKIVIKNFGDLYYRSSDVISETKLSILITEKGGNGMQFGLNKKVEVKSLNNVFSDLRKTEVSNVLFQIIFGLEVMQKFRLVHNDLHSNNILIAEFPEPITLYFRLPIKNGTRVFRINTKYIPYIFDWDFAYCESLGMNKKILKYNYLNIFNRFSKKVDLYTLFCSLTRYCENKYNNIGEKYYKNSKIFTSKEYDKEYTVSEDVFNKIVNLPSYIHETKKLSKNQLDDIWPEHPFPNATSVILELGDNNNIRFYNPFSCRITAIDESFPTPLTLLMNDFDDLEIKEEIPENYPYVYTMPNIEQAQAIFIDQRHRDRGREKIVGKPRFPLQKSGRYVRTLHE